MPLTPAEQKQYKALYVQTARQYIKELQHALMQLQSGNETTEIIDTLHRAAHSLKGQSLMMSYQSMSEISLLMEKIFMGKKEKKLDLTKEFLSKLDEMTQHMEASLDSIDAINQEKDLSEHSKDLKKWVTILE